jgi:hypothetical protein
MIPVTGVTSVTGMTGMTGMIPVPVDMAGVVLVLTVGGNRVVVRVAVVAGVLAVVRIVHRAPPRCVIPLGGIWRNTATLSGIPAVLGTESP